MGFIMIQLNEVTKADLDQVDAALMALEIQLPLLNNHLVHESPHIALDISLETFEKIVLALDNWNILVDMNHPWQEDFDKLGRKLKNVYYHYSSKKLYKK